MTQAAPSADYVGLGRQLAELLGTCQEGQFADALRDVARSWDPAVTDARLAAEVFLLQKYLLVQACVGIFPERHVERVIGGLFVALEERASHLDINEERRASMEQLWLTRASQFDRSFLVDRKEFLEDAPGTIHWKRTITRFCQNVKETPEPLDILGMGEATSLQASLSVTSIISTLLKNLGEMTQSHFGEAV